MSEIFTVEKKEIYGALGRAPGSTLRSNDRLMIVYNKYSNKALNSNDQKVKINLIFAHGTGMNKSIWSYHIKLLYEASRLAKDWVLDKVVSVDAASHGDSALRNAGKMGWIFRWDDGARDLISVVRHENETTGDFINGMKSKTILIGHSMGGYMVTCASYLEPNLFDSVVAVEPVIYSDPSQLEKYLRLFSKIKGLIIDEFADRDEVDEFYRKFSFFKTMRSEVLDDFIADEVIESKDPDTGELHYKAKTTSDLQFTAYLSATVSLPVMMLILPNLTIPFYNMACKTATWNPREAPEYVNSTVPGDIIHPIWLAKGLHLVHGDFPELVVDEFIKIISERANIAIELYPYYPEVRFKGQEDKIVDHYTNYLLQGKIQEFASFKPKL